MKNFMNLGLVVVLIAGVAFAKGGKRPDLKNVPVGFEGIEIPLKMQMHLHEKYGVRTQNNCATPPVLCVRFSKITDMGMVNAWGSGYTNNSGSQSRIGRNRGSYRSENVGTTTTLGYSKQQLQAELIVELRIQGEEPIPEAIVTNYAFPGTTSVGGSYGVCRNGSSSRINHQSSRRGLSSSFRSNGSGVYGSSDSTEVVTPETAIQHSIEGAVAKLLGIPNLYQKVDQRIDVRWDGDAKADIASAFGK